MDHSHPKQIVVRTYTIDNSVQPQPNTNRSLNDYLLQPNPVKKLSKIHNSHKCNKQKHPSTIPQAHHYLHPNPNPSQQPKRIDIYQHRYRRVHTQAKKHITTKLNSIAKSESKPTKIYLPNLKKFDDFDYQTDQIVKPNISHPKPVERRQESGTPIEGITALESNIKIENIRLPHPLKKEQASQQTIRVNDRGKNRPHNKIYKYIENYLNNDTPSNIKRKPTRQEDEYSQISSFSPSFQKEPRVIFHQFKHKAAQPKQRTPSFLEKPLFDVSQIKQHLNDFVLTYTPFNRYFDLKEFIRDPTVQIVTEERSIFVGTIVDNKKEGKGVLLTEKQLFEGEFSNNLKSSGFQKNKNGLYQGKYELGRRSGNGKFVWTNGETYEGDWRLGQKHGHGIWKSPKGDYYQGEWKQNLQNGKGCYFHKGCSMYRGYFKNSLKHGRGEEQFENGDKYQGEYQKGKPHGYGKYAWANGDIYEGDFAQGSREGKGTLKRIVGQTYEGQFKSDLKEGSGKQLYAKGEYFQGVFEKGVKISGTFFSKQGKVLQSY